MAAACIAMGERPLQPYVIVDLTISAEEYLKLYQGVARDVVGYARDGRSVRFPAKILQPYVTHDGIRGSFCISFDKDQKFSSIRKIG